MARIIWMDPEIESTIAHLRGVRGELRSQANKYGAIARGNLLAHRAEGYSSISVTRGTLLDYYVNLEDKPSASSQGMPRAHIVEFGREGAEAPAPLRRAFGLNIRK